VFARVVEPCAYSSRPEEINPFDLQHLACAQKIHQQKPCLPRQQLQSHSICSTCSMCLEHIRENCVLPEDQAHLVGSFYAGRHMHERHFFVARYEHARMKDNESLKIQVVVLHLHRVREHQKMLSQMQYVP